MFILYQHMHKKVVQIFNINLHYLFVHMLVYKKVKQSHYRPGEAQRVLRKLRFPDFVTTAQDGGRLSALRTGRLYPQEMLLALISVRGWSRPQGHSVIGRILCQ